MKNIIELLPDINVKDFWVSRNLDGASDNSECSKDSDNEVQIFDDNYPNNESHDTLVL